MLTVRSRILQEDEPETQGCEGPSPFELVGKANVNVDVFIPRPARVVLVGTERGVVKVYIRLPSKTNLSPSCEDAAASKAAVIFPLYVASTSNKRSDEAGTRSGREAKGRDTFPKGVLKVAVGNSLVTPA